jgi:hypothetical protein
MRRRVLIVLIAVIILLGVGSYMAWRIARKAAREVITDVITKKEEQVDLTALVTQVRELSRLETASMRVMHVSTITQGYQMVPDSLGGDQMTFLAVGDVIAGINLSLLQQKDVWRDGDGTIVLRLPPSQILITRVDNRESRVINRKTGLLRKADINLESRARQHAEQAIRNEAVRKGILPMASQNAEKKIADFLHTLGAQKVRFENSAFARPSAPIEH